ncbi:MAG TPA: hypothetical protein VN809_03630, partial [Telmatospirillum sp.]|nr:hypothetical protein [Telmatospirillum sp.]
TLLENTSRAVTATAIEACEVIRITMDHLQSELDKLSPFMRNWVDSHSEHLIFLLSKLANTDF